MVNLRAEPETSRKRHDRPIHFAFETKHISDRINGTSRTAGDSGSTSGAISEGRRLMMFVAKTRYFLFMSSSPRKVCRKAIAMYALQRLPLKIGKKKWVTGEGGRGSIP